LSRETHKTAEAETVRWAEGNMCGAVLRGADALPWSKIPSRTKGSRRKLGGLMSDQGRPETRSWPASGRRGAVADDARAREVGQMRSTDEACEQSRAIGGGVGGGKASGRGEYRAGNARSGYKAGLACHNYRHGLAAQLHGSPKPRAVQRYHPRQEPGAGKPHAGICAGGAQQCASLPRLVPPFACGQHARSRPGEDLLVAASRRIPLRGTAATALSCNRGISSWSLCRFQTDT